MAPTDESDGSGKTLGPVFTGSIYLACGPRDDLACGPRALADSTRRCSAASSRERHDALGQWWQTGDHAQQIGPDLQVDTEVGAGRGPGCTDLHLHRGLAFPQGGEALGHDPSDRATL